MEKDKDQHKDRYKERKDKKRKGAAGLLLALGLILASLPVMGAAAGNVSEMETAEAEPDKPQGDQTETGETEPDKSQTGETETGKTEPGKTQANETETGETEPGKTQADETETGETEPDKTQAGQSEAGEPGTDNEPGANLGKAETDEAETNLSDAEIETGTENSTKTDQTEDGESEELTEIQMKLESEKEALQQLTETSEAEFTVTIPPTASVNTGSMTISASSTDLNTDRLEVKVFSRNDFQLKKTASGGEDTSIGYTLIPAGGSALTQGGTAASFTDGENQSQTLTFQLNAGEVSSGSYTDTLTFTVIVTGGEKTS
ncbi:MAG: hypothetical protein PHE06_07100 [Lachnospiraceae bacterium]|nr:hypothetical protein [Lachnospiraceae bacterium]